MNTIDIENINVSAFDPMPSPEDILADLPLSTEAARTVMRGRETLRNILERKDHRLFVVVGPCSIHDPLAGIENERRLRKLSDDVSETLFTVSYTHLDVYKRQPYTCRCHQQSFICLAV